MYKWVDEEETVIKYDGMVIPIDENNRHYQEFLKSGEVPAPWKDENELKKIKKDKDEKDLKVKLDADIASILDPNVFFKTISRAIRLLRREMKLVATPEEKAELNLLADMDIAMDALLEQYETDKKKIKEEK